MIVAIAVYAVGAAVTATSAFAWGRNYQQRSGLSTRHVAAMSAVLGAIWPVTLLVAIVAVVTSVVTNAADRHRRNR